MKDYLKRQQMMFTEQENKKISKLNVMIAGVGGLGTNLAQQLLRIGINKMYLYDYDIIETSNLNRQLFYGKDDIGKKKVNIAKKYLENFNLDTEVIAFEKKIKEGLSIPKDIDLIFDGLDNFKSRFILEELALKENKPLIHGGINSWYGQVFIVIPKESSRLKEIFKGVDNDKSVPSAFSPVVSIIASLQVIEGLKLYLNRKDILKNKLLLVDLETGKIEEVKISKNNRE